MEYVLHICSVSSKQLVSVLGDPLGMIIFVSACYILALYNRRRGTAQNAASVSFIWSPVLSEFNILHPLYWVSCLSVLAKKTPGFSALISRAKMKAFDADTYFGNFCQDYFQEALSI